MEVGAESESTGVLLRAAERYPDGALVSVRIRGGRIVAVDRDLERERGEVVIEARGGSLLPGLHDHHLHLFALAAARDSVHCGPPAVTTVDALARALHSRSGTGWLRGVGYHESVAGELDRYRLDALVPDRPLRIQHASGKAWFVNSSGARLLDLDRHAHLEGVECDVAGVPTGRLFRLDDWVRSRLAGVDPPDPAAVSAGLAACGITGITDTTAHNDAAAVELFGGAIARGALRQRVRMMGGAGLAPGPRGDRLCVGELKILLDEDRLPDLDALTARVREAHAGARGVAFHCVSRTELVYALHVLEVAGARDDRIEHAAVTPPELYATLRALGVAVVTQPGFIAERGDRYLAEADADEIPHLYRLQSFLTHGIPLALSSDAPYGDPDPWRAMRAAVERRTRSGAIVDAAEALTPEAALAGFLGPAAAPGRAQRGIVLGAVADLCLLDRPWREARVALHAAAVRLTMVAGETVYDRARH